MLNLENGNFNDEELEEYLSQLEMVEPPKAMAGEIIDRAKEQKKTHREIILLDSRVFKVLLSLSACFILLFTGTFQSLVSKSIEYSGEITAFTMQKATNREEALQKKIDEKLVEYQQKVEKGLERYGKK